MYEEVPNSGTTVYYLGRGVGADGSSAVPFPEGLRMLSGENFARHYDNTTMTWGNKTYPPRPVADRVSFVCIDYNNAIPQSTGMVNTTCPDGLRAQSTCSNLWHYPRSTIDIGNSPNAELLGRKESLRLGSKPCGISLSDRVSSDSLFLQPLNS